MDSSKANLLYQELSELNVIPKKTLDAVYEEANKDFDAVTRMLVDKDYLTDENLGQILADIYNVPFIRIEDYSLPPVASFILPEEYIRLHKVFVFDVTEDTALVAMSNPEDEAVPHMIEQKTGLKVKLHYATESDILKATARFHSNLQGDFDTLIKNQVQASGETGSGEAPIIAIVDLLIEYAYGREASDVHIEPERETSVVRFRVDGVLTEVLTFPKEIHERIIARIKVMSKLRSDEHLSPQDGKMKVPLRDENLDIRVSIVPITTGEKAVLRLLASRFRQFGLKDLGMSEQDLKKVHAAIMQPFGMILSTGPTGSGKSTTIYSILKILNSRERNISTIEDPVEYAIEGINQIQVNEKANVTFANGLRSILRQDPNIIYVGEIRDNETAEISINSALTGHLVFSTLHTNNAATAIPRLIDMGIEPFLISSTIQLVIAQRLVRKICDSCKVSYSVQLSDLEENLDNTLLKHIFGSKKKSITAYKGKGCNVCNMSGYNGRIGIFELLVIDETIKALIMAEENSGTVETAARENGMVTMMEDGLRKVQSGLTTFEEIIRTTKG